MKYLLSFFFFTIPFVKIHLQEWKMNYHGLPHELASDKKKYEKTTNPNKTLNELYNKLIQSGYLGTSIDSIIKNDILRFYEVYFYTGDQYQYSNLGFNQKDEAALNSSGFREKLFHQKPFNPKQLGILFQKLLAYHENSGYPFCSIQLDSLQLKDNMLNSYLNINKGPIVHIDSIYIKGGVRNSKKLIYTLIKTFPGDLYNQRLIDEIDTRIAETPYLISIKATEYEFTQNGCNLYLYISNAPSSNINGVIGFLPDNTGKINITGDAKIKLKNSFYKGETIDINWKKIQLYTQRLNSSFNYPFLFNSSFGFNFKFDLFKKDTSYINLNTNIGIQYSFNSDNKLIVFYQNNSSNLLSTTLFSSLSSLPDFADIQTNSYGIEIESQHLDYRNNPRSGRYIQLLGSVGNKKIIKNINLNPIVYENKKLTTIQYNVISDLAFYLPFKKRNTIKFGAKGGFIFNETMFNNELHRIGGYMLLRGFNEESIYTSSYAIGTVEYRFLLERNSNLFAFVDGGWYEKQTHNDFISDTPIGTGIGISFSTKPGIFSVSYAIGKQQGDPFQFKTAKIHFGFVNFF